MSLRALLVFVPVLVVLIGFQLAKRRWAWVDDLSPVLKQAIVVVLVVTASMTLSQLGWSAIPELHAFGTQAVIAFVQAFAAIGSHNVAKTLKEG